jgi:hypothetical protein
MKDLGRFLDFGRGWDLGVSKTKSALLGAPQHPRYAVCAMHEYDVCSSSCVKLLRCCAAIDPWFGSGVVCCMLVRPAAGPSTPCCNVERA